MEILLSVLFWLITSQQNHFADMRIMAILPPASVETLGKVPEKSKTVVSKAAKPKAKKPAGKFASKKVVLDDSKAEIARYICSKDWDCKTAVAICYAGSGLNPNMKSKTNDHGVCDINAYWQRNRIKGRDLYDWKQNVDIMHEIYQEQGFEPYYQFQNETYKKYLNVETASGSIIQEGGGSE